MSGGSYEYLFLKDCPGDIFEFSYTENLEKMIIRLRDSGYEEIADEFQAYSDKRNKLAQEACDSHDRLAGIMKAVEWCDSGDQSEKDVVEAVEKFRQQKITGNGE